MSDLFGAEAPPDSPWNPEPELDDEDLAATEAALRASLEADGVKMCSNCGTRPVRPRKTKAGRAPTTCQVCAAAKGRGGKADVPPASIKINMGGTGRTSRRDSDSALVEDRAKQLALALATGMTVVGARADAKILAEGAGAWAKAVAGLAPYEPWLVNLCKGGEVSGRSMAWATAGVATAGMVVPILVLHELIPAGPLTKMFESVAELAARQAEEDAAAAPPAAA